MFALNEGSGWGGEENRHGAGERPPPAGRRLPEEMSGAVGEGSVPSDPAAWR